MCHKTTLACGGLSRRLDSLPPALQILALGVLSDGRLAVAQSLLIEYGELVNRQLLPAGTGDEKERCFPPDKWMVAVVCCR